MRSKTWLITLAVLAVLAAAFLFANFHAAASRTQWHDNAATARSGGDVLPVTMQQRSPLTLVVTGDPALAEPLKQALLKKFQYAGLGDVALAEAGGQAHPAPVLFIEVGQPNRLWTPFYASGQVPVKTQFISNGEAAAMHSGPTEMSNADGPSLASDGDFTVEDRSWGLISRPGYDQMLADGAAQHILDATLKLYEMIPAG